MLTAAILSEYLEKGLTQVHLDARHLDVMVPPHLAGERQLRLNLSWNFPNSPMFIADDGVHVTLTFGGVGFACVLPYSAIYAVLHPGTTDGRVYVDLIPKDMRAAWAQALEEEGVSQRQAVPEEKPVDTVGVKRRGFTVLKGGKS